MNEGKFNLRPSVIPHLWYPDPTAAASFLERAFGFHAHFTAPECGDALHAELSLGRGLVLIGQVDAPKFMFRTPREAGGVNTGAPYIATRDVDALYRRAKEAGAEIVRDLVDTEYGSRDFSARDPDGYLWNFGTYHPTIGDGKSGTDLEPEVFDALRYERPRTAMNWLIRAFGFEQHYVVSGDGEEEIPHALLRFGNSLLMVGSTRRDDSLKLMPPQQLGGENIGGTHTQVIYVVVADPDAHYALAKAEKADVLEELADTPWGGRQYTARDPEGYVWCFTSRTPASLAKASSGTTLRARTAQV